ncbi:MAG: oxaloacetate-decarboxylating malate dehydrogenase, partial [Candidatus Limnocylindria bacterium]
VIQWEDFKQHNALRILDRYRDRVPSFNDDVQGTAAVVLAGVLAALRLLEQPLGAQRILLAGAGAAGIGIARLLRVAMLEAGMSADEVARALVAFDSKGIVHADRDDLDDTKRSFATPQDLRLPLARELASAVEAYRPTMIVGTTGVSGTFSEPAIRAMAASCDRPIILPLSNPTAIAEARPADLLRWTDSRALVATGSPFPAVDGREIGQANNVFIFPGLGLGTIVAEATRVSDGMALAAARTLADAVSDERLRAGALYPPIGSLRSVSRAIALAVAREAIASGIARPNDGLEIDVDAAMWWPAYVPYLPPPMARA